MSCDVRLMLGDCLDRMGEVADGSVDAIICDPPYGISFLGREWDHGVPGVPFWEAALRVAKPGAHLVAFGGTRTYHRLTCAIEDAGWEIRDCLVWLYGQGMPKGKHVLKPGWEPILLARKPPVGSVARNVAEYGCGGLNVDGCRIAMTQENADFIRKTARPNTAGRVHIGNVMNRPAAPTVNIHDQGRWPANVVLAHTPECRAVGVKKVKGTNPPGPNRQKTGFSQGWTRTSSVLCYADHDGTETVEAFECSEDCPVRMLDEQAGERTGDSLTRKPRVKAKEKFGWSGPASMDYQTSGFTDTGGASRFFYCSKASPSERGVDNFHPTVKPIALMRWLVRLVSPPGSVVLDPFAGSCSTGIACLDEGMRFLGIEKDPDYHAIGMKRLAAHRDSMPLLAGVAS